jgi:hypothetical protein
MSNWKKRLVYVGSPGVVAIGLAMFAFANADHQLDADKIAAAAATKTTVTKDGVAGCGRRQATLGL